MLKVTAEYQNAGRTADADRLFLNLVAETGSSDPQELTQIGSTLFFVAGDKTHGRELWKKDGASAAVLVKDIFAGTESASINELTAVGSSLFFSANNGINGQELWKSDGTAADTVLMKDYWTSAGDATTRNYSSGPAELTAVGGKLYYRANPDVSIVSPFLMVSDGTTAGTKLFHDFTGDAGSSHPENLTVISGRIFGSVMSEAMGREPVSVIDVFTPAAPSIPRLFPHP